MLYLGNYEIDLYQDFEVRRDALWEKPTRIKVMSLTAEFRKNPPQYETFPGEFEMFHDQFWPSVEQGPVSFDPGLRRAGKILD